MVSKPGSETVKVDRVVDLDSREETASVGDGRAVGVDVDHDEVGRFTGDPDSGVGAGGPPAVDVPQVGGAGVEAVARASGPGAGAWSGGRGAGPCRRGSSLEESPSPEPVGALAIRFLRTSGPARARTRPCREGPRGGVSSRRRT